MLLGTEDRLGMQTRILSDIDELDPERHTGQHPLQREYRQCRTK